MGLRERLLIRFIPTHVGNTWSGRTGACCGSVHPHTRGEHGVPVHEVHRVNGSSPHTWGTLGTKAQVKQLLRFIPTHVGNTACFRRNTPDCSVHPHTRGEHFIGYFQNDRTHGSSPHTWGTHGEDARYDGAPRFIPTHVGNTTRRDSISGLPSVHPHTRGEHDECISPMGTYAGSSPHTWGTRLETVTVLSLIRFIPPHVGNSWTVGPQSAGAPVHPHTRGTRAGD